ncbi:hypothetical protein MUK42_30798 [Musa troglodytarum]|uniref:Exopolyphosphatase n=1 Tax=Musa troglodytarum TaxID=320322 RepID=A0A9E7FG53_9LILI|nr:hypothetical protein MUK42_30798 [Musa troglodytarum]
MKSQKRGAANRGQPLPDLTDFMNDWFFGSVNVERRTYDLGGGRAKKEEDDRGGAKKPTSTLTQEWLEEARKVVAGSPPRPGSPARFLGSPRFAAAEATESSPLVDRRDPLSRSARRHRSFEGISDEILRRSSSRVSRTTSSESLLPPSETHSTATGDPHPASDGGGRPPPPQSLAPKEPYHRTSRFREETSSEPLSPAATSRRTFRSRSPAPPPAEAVEDAALLSPPRNLVEPAYRRSVSSFTCSLETLTGLEKEKGSDRRRAISSSLKACNRLPELTPPENLRHINAFLRRQRKMIERISRGEASAKAKIILSGSSNSTTSSMVAAICYAWLLWNREEKEVVVVPVENMERRRMTKHKQAAWLFYHVGIDASALLFADEVDLENLLMARQLAILVIGQDVLKTNNEVGSLCTILTDNYCEEAYDLLQNPNLKKLLLAGILLDTQNLDDTAQFVTKRDEEAVRLLSVGFSPNYRQEFFSQLMQENKEDLFLEALKNNYGMLSCETKEKSPPVLAPIPVPLPVKAPETNSRGKNKFFLAKWFGFGSK